MMKFILAVVLLTLSVAPLMQAQDKGNPPSITTLSDKLQALLPDGISIRSVADGIVNGVYQIELTDSSFFYVVGEQYLVQGELYGFRGKTLVNLTEERARAPRRIQLIGSVYPEDTIIYSPKNEAKAILTVFTDVDCGYCRKFHRNIKQLNDYGIEIRYLAWPRSGPDSKTADKMITAWCSPNRHSALTKLKRGESLPLKRCTNPIAKQHELGRQLGIRGTPTIVSSGGDILPGYLPPEALLEWLGL